MLKNQSITVGIGELFLIRENNSLLLRHTEGELNMRKKWEELGISNSFIFGKVMQNPEICKEFLEIVLDIKIDRIEYPFVEKTLKLTYDGKGVRLDVYVADGKNTVYNIEMQASDTKEIPARSRYYQSIIDMELIEQGSGYNKLNRSYVIFICTFDLFSCGRYRYTFEHRCMEDTSIRLDDGTTRIFLNTKGILDTDDISDDMRAFLSYVEGNVSNNTFVQRITEEVDMVKSNKKLRGEYMNQVVRDHLNREEGIIEGVIKGKIEDRIELIRKNIPQSSPASIASFLQEDILYVQNICRLLDLYPNESDGDIARRILESEQEIVK